MPASPPKRRSKSAASSCCSTTCQLQPLILFARQVVAEHDEQRERQDGGRLGGEARQWLRSHVAQLPEDVRQQELARAYKVVSCALQGQLARQLRKAAGLH